ncbi:unnamed protein product [Amoebophrya sp. A120]|nr:unnamed protein product [Amoebophrya sp. A120]|eukprot:GSA120T00024973001.1
MADSDIQITFDADNHIRVLDPEKFKQMENLSQECQNFTEKIHQFGTTVQTLVDVLDGQAKRIEFEKLRAIGQKNLAEMESENRRRKQQQMRALIASKEAELSRLTTYYDSLEKVEREQKAMIERLSNNDV